MTTSMRREARRPIHPRPRPVLAPACSLAAPCLLAGCALGSYLAYRMAPDYPRDESEQIALAGLSAPVRVCVDSAGVPHIDAESEDDLLRATGFMQARSRFFQMDVLCRLARGRLAELVGERAFLAGTTVELDRAMRCWGFEEAALAETAALDPESRRPPATFVEGANVGLARFEPFEYRLLGVPPEPWTIEDGFAIGLLTAWGVTHNWHQETSRYVSGARLDPGVRLERVAGAGINAGRDRPGERLLRPRERPHDRPGALRPIRADRQPPVVPVRQDRRADRLRPRLRRAPVPGDGRAGLPDGRRPPRHASRPLDPGHGGASGWPGSPHYGDQHELWKRGETVPMISDWETIREQAAALLTLR